MGKDIYLLSAAETVLVFDNKGNKLFESGAVPGANALCRDSAGQVYLLSGKAEGKDASLLQINRKEKALKGICRNIPVGNLYAAEKDMLLIADRNGLNCLDMRTGKAQPVLQWLDYGIAAENLAGLTYMEDGSLLFLINQENGNGQKRVEAVRLSVSSEEKKETDKKELILATGPYQEPVLEAAVLAFNQSSEDCRVRLKRYGEEGGAEKMIMDILSGEIPDLIDLNYCPSISACISKGILADLYPLLDKDDSLSREDLVANALRMLEQDGKLYGMPRSFSLNTLMGRESDVGSDMGWTIEDVKLLLTDKPEGTYLISEARQEAFHMLLWAGMESFIDWNAGICMFDSKEFIDLLELAVSLPDTPLYQSDNTEWAYTKISQGKLLLQILNLYKVADYSGNAALFGGAPVTCIGYPATEGIGAVMVMGNGLGIAEKSEQKEDAWKFIRFLLKDEYQRQESGFPVVESVLERVMEESRGGIVDPDFEYIVQSVTQEEMKVVRSLIDQAVPVPHCFGSIYQLVEEEAAAYLTGQKPVEEVAEIIQNRVSIYMAENR